MKKCLAYAANEGRKFLLKILRYGDTGALVALLQEGLIRAGWDPGAVDGIFGSGT